MEKKGCSLKGCLIGCGAMILLMVILSVSTGLWLTGKGEFIADTTILHEDTDMFFRVYVQEGDETMVNFATNFTNRMNEIQNSGMPRFFRDWQEKSTRKDFEKMLPVEFELAYELDNRGYDGAIGISIYNNLLNLGYRIVKWRLRDGGHVFEHNGREYITDPDNPHGEVLYFAMEQNTIFFSRSEAGMHRMLDSLDAGPSDHSIDARFSGGNTTAPIYGFASGPEGARKLVEVLRDEGSASLDARTDEFLGQIDHLIFDLNVAGGDALRGNLYFNVSQKTPEMLEALDRSLATMEENVQATVTHTRKRRKVITRL
ncbi:MAG: hypothetical protein QNK37_09620 [Acidobacteriota bacterium]|nr:hypothetical protein [Acidobacteriota bacterium]